ncbi:hypothetical protein [Sporosarcina sp. G11-34]|uniref:hypothetical protein n=1 Tax=Sporosarcina sp. G11-34 TaxID=2849605 RepID=UPI0022A8FA39|nr:hypothetical protein [Sporosarcina sp. G11-34]MCZ2260103.1 hypothetical protein [Sporosarcina sp. G11-34]
MGVVSIALLASFLLLLLPENLEELFLPIVKLAMGIWIIRSVFSLFGHSFQ